MKRLLVLSFALTALACAKKSDPASSTDNASGDGGGAGTPTLCVGKIIFTTPVSSGNFGGKAGADTLCNSNKPTGFSSSTFKALLTDVGGGRRACYISGDDSCYSSVVGRMDWPLTAGTTYCSTDYARTLGTADAKALLFPNDAVTTTSLTVFTGFNIAYGSSTTGRCSDWSVTSGTGNGGNANGQGQDFIASTFPSCASAANIYCVEQ